MSGRIMLLVAALALPLMIWGCSKAPQLEIDKANAALAAARAAEAQQYAPQSLTVAQDTLNVAMTMKQEQDSKFALFRSYGKSKAMFARAEALALAAENDAKAEKERVRLEVADLLAQVMAELDAARAALDAAPVGKGNKAEIELIRNDINNLGASYAEAKAEFDAGRFLTAKSKVQTISDRVRSIMDEIATAAAKRTGRR